MEVKTWRVFHFKCNACGTDKIARRAIVGEWPIGDYHLMEFFERALLRDIDCLVCKSSDVELVKDSNGFLVSELVVDD